MNIVVGSGKNRRSFTIGHKATMTRGERDKMREDLVKKATPSVGATSTLLISQAVSPYFAHIHDMLLVEMK